MTYFLNKTSSEAISDECGSLELKIAHKCFIVLEVQDF